MTITKWSGGDSHWIKKKDINLFLWNKKSKSIQSKGVVLFIHGSSMASQPTFDLQVEGRPYSSAMDWFSNRGFDTWTLDNEGYGRSDKNRNINFDIQNGMEDIACAVDYILSKTQSSQVHLYGISSGALKAALYAQTYPSSVSKLMLDAFVWTGENSPTLENRRKKLTEFENI